MPGQVSISPQIREVSFDGAADHGPREFVEHHTVEALLSLLGLPAQSRIHLGRDAADGVMPR